VIQRGHNGVAAGAGGRSGRSVVSDRNAAQTGRVGRDRDGLRRSIVGLDQVAQRDRRRTLADGQGAGGVGSGVVRIVQRGHNSVAPGVGGRGRRSVVSDRDSSQIIGAGRGRDGLRRSVVGLRQVAQGDRRRSLGDRQRAGGIGTDIIWIRLGGDNRVAAHVCGRRCRSVVSDRDVHTGGAGRGSDNPRRSIVGLRQVAERERRGRLVNGQRAGGVVSVVVLFIVADQRGDNRIAAGIGGRGCSSFVGDGDV